MPRMLNLTALPIWSGRMLGTPGLAAKIRWFLGAAAVFHKMFVMVSYDSKGLLIYYVAHLLSIRGYT